LAWTWLLRLSVVLSIIAIAASCYSLSDHCYSDIAPVHVFRRLLPGVLALGLVHLGLWQLATWLFLDPEEDDFYGGRPFTFPVSFIYATTSFSIMVERLAGAFARREAEKKAMADGTTLPTHNEPAVAERRG